jgi:hypothetical protein
MPRAPSRGASERCVSGEALAARWLQNGDSVSAAADREIVLAPETSAFEQAKAIVRYCAGLGYPLTLADFNKLAFAEDHALMRWIKSELIADRPAFLDRYRHDNQEDTMAPKKKTEKTKKPKPSAPKLDAAAAKERPDTKVERFRSRLRVLLPRDAVAERADRMAHVIGERENLVAQAKAATAHLKAQIKEKDAEIGALSAQIRDKAEYAEVECERRHHYRAGTIVEVRLDTDETTFERAMTFSERQLDLPAKKAAEPKKAPESADSSPSNEDEKGEAADQPANDDAPESGETGDEDEDDEEQTAE